MQGFGSCSVQMPEADAPPPRQEVWAAADVHPRAASCMHGARGTCDCHECCRTVPEADTRAPRPRLGELGAHRRQGNICCGIFVRSAASASAPQASRGGGSPAPRAAGAAWVTSAVVLGKEHEEHVLGSSCTS